MSVWWLVALLIAGFGVAFLAQLGDRRAESRRRWAREAQRRAPARVPQGTPYDDLLEHAERQLELLLTERHHVRLLLQKGELLRRRMQRSAQLRDKVVEVERVLTGLRERAERLEQLAARYRQQRDDLGVLRDTVAFDQAVEAVAGAGDGTPATLRGVSQTLDEEIRRLADLQAAEEELDVLLRS